MSLGRDQSLGAQKGNVYIEGASEQYDGDATRPSFAEAASCGKFAIQYQAFLQCFWPADCQLPTLFGNALANDTKPVPQFFSVLSVREQNHMSLRHFLLQFGCILINPSNKFQKIQEKTLFFGSKMW